MTSELDRQMVFKTTQVRTALRKDGSWIRKKPEPEVAQPCMAPVNPSVETSMRESHSPSPKSPGPQSTTSVQDTPNLPEWKGRKSSLYIRSALKKFESEGTTGSAQEKQPSKAAEISSTAHVKAALVQPDTVTTPAVLTPAATSPEDEASSDKVPVSKTSIKADAVTEPEVEGPGGKSPETPVVETPGVRLCEDKTPQEEDAPVQKAPEVKAPVMEMPAVKAGLKISGMERSAAKQLKEQPKEPQVKTPGTDVKETPVINAPEIKVHEVKEPEVKTLSVTETPIAKPPGIKTYGNKTPEVKTPAANVPDVKAPEVKTSAEEIPEAETPVVKTSTPAISPAASTRPSAPGSSTVQSPRIFCSFCNTPVVGNVKVTISHPPSVCHAECFKCAVCAKPLGDMLSQMFHHKGRVHCEGCFHLLFWP